MIVIIVSLRVFKIYDVGFFIVVIIIEFMFVFLFVIILYDGCFMIMRDIIIDVYGVGKVWELFIVIVYEDMMVVSISCLIKYMERR